MIVWKILGNEIGPDGCGASHFAKKSDAIATLREHGIRDQEPMKVVVSNRNQLASALDEAMGYGCT